MRGAAVRSDVDRARDELLAGAALAGNQHRQSRCPAAAESARRPGSSRRWRRGSLAAAARATVDRRPARRRRDRSRAAQSANPCRATAVDHAQPAHATGWPIGRGDATTDAVAAIGVCRPSGSTTSVLACRSARCRPAPRAHGRAPLRGRSRRSRRLARRFGEFDVHDRAVRRPPLRAVRRRSHDRAVRAAPPHPRSAARCASSASAGEMTYFAGADRASAATARRRCRRCRVSAPSCWKIGSAASRWRSATRAGAGSRRPDGRGRGG